MALRKASTETTRLDLGDGDWIEVRNDISKRERNTLVGYFPEREIDPSSGEARLLPSEAVNLQTGMFSVLVTAWSADVPCTVDEYLALEDEAAERIDVALAEHFNSLRPTEAEAKKSFRSGRASRARV